MLKPLKGKIALVTGASRGIGKAIAKRYAVEGAHVILLARNASYLEKVSDEIYQLGGSSLIVPFDLCELVKIEDLAIAIGKQYQKLDILVGNAAILGALSPLSHVKPSTWHEVMTVNLHANWHLIRNFEGLLHKSSHGRLIFVTDQLNPQFKSYWGPYTASKAALEGIVRTYAAEVKNSPLRVNLVNPGPTRTDMRAEAMPGEIPSDLPHPDGKMDVFVKLAEENCSFHGEILNANNF